MHHFKCAPCRTRLASQSDSTEERCPECGAELVYVESPTEIVGYAAIAPRELTVLDQAVAAALPVPPQV